MAFFCPDCRATFEEDLAKCPHDGSQLFQLDKGVDPLIGMIIDERFQVDWKLGSGGMGAVYRATQLSVNREVALKVLHQDLTDRETSLGRFFREAKLVSELTHPNIVRLIDFGQDRKTDLLYLVMELVRGTDLGELLQNGRFRVAMALEIVFQVCGALTEPHARGVIHRDLKPDNLLVMPVSDGTLQVKVLDFGIARTLQNDTQLTATGMICGTPAYMAPEQAQNQELGPRTDLYALGVLLYQMLCGQPPFEGTSSLQILLKHIQEQPRSFRELMPAGAIPDEVEELVFAMISKRVEDRPESALAVRERIDAIRQRLSIAPVRIKTMDPEEMFNDWLLPSLPHGSRIISGPTEALRRETDMALRMISDYENLAAADTAAGILGPALTEDGVEVEKMGPEEMWSDERIPARAQPRQGGVTATDSAVMTFASSAVGQGSNHKTALIIAGMFLFSLVLIGGFAIWMNTTSGPSSPVVLSEFDPPESEGELLVIGQESEEIDKHDEDKSDEVALEESEEIDDAAVVGAGEEESNEAESGAAPEKKVEANPAPPRVERTKAAPRQTRPGTESVKASSSMDAKTDASTSPSAQEKASAPEARTESETASPKGFFGSGGILRGKGE